MASNNQGQYNMSGSTSQQGQNVQNSAQNTSNSQPNQGGSSGGTSSQNRQQSHHRQHGHHHHHHRPKHAVHWFRKGLRLSDNPALRRAINNRYSV